MPQLIEKPTRVEAAGNKPKLIDEYVGRVNTAEERQSIALMQSPAGWVEPGQRPDFDEYTLVIDGQFGFLDARNFRLRGTSKLQCELTLRAGQVVWDLNGTAGQDLEIGDASHGE